ncbi:MAG: magnesium transporter [Chthonomonas sp.]|nr:magnesium transporter [Chthonomonas sp.]
MAVDLKNLVESLRSLSRLRSTEAVRTELEEIRPEDLAEALPRLDTDEALSLLQMMEPDAAADTLVELPPETTRNIVAELDDATLAHYLDILPMDDALDLRDEVGEERFDALLNVIPKQDALEIRRLLNYPEDSVGRLMTEAYFEVKPGTTMAELIDDIRRSPAEKYEMVNDIYVLSEDKHILGVLSLRKAIRANPISTAREVMKESVVTVSALDRDEDGARLMSRYGLYALPVVNNRGQMVGLFTGDDAQAILREADTEDVLKLGAVSGDAEAYLSLSVLRLAWKRIPWLLGLFAAETLTGMVMRHYLRQEQANITVLASLMAFLPLIIGAGGNCGSQVTSMVTRGLAVGEIRLGDSMTILRRELVTSILCGLVLGICGYVRALLWGSSNQVSLVVGLALPLVIIWAGTVGSLLPIGAKRAGIDPAVMSAPFISTLVDATGLIIYFELARRIIGLGWNN